MKMAWDSSSLMNFQIITEILIKLSFNDVLFPIINHSFPMTMAIKPSWMTLVFNYILMFYFYILSWLFVYIFYLISNNGIEISDRELFKSKGESFVWRTFNSNHQKQA